MVEDMEMEEERVEVYEVVEIDFDYEFDAATFFDFTRTESEAESRVSESWFFSAPDYPPSPFVTQLFPLNGLNTQHVDASPKSIYDDRLLMDDASSDIAQHIEHYNQDKAYREESSPALLQKINHGRSQNSQDQAECLHGGSLRGLTFYNHLAHNIKNSRTKSLAKPSMRKSSTLMKPTASQLAKQNQQRQVSGYRLQKTEGNSGAHSGIESQASKRQKLDGGLLHRIVDMKQPVNLIHKLPKKDVAVQGLHSQTKLRITIPREPDLATAHRAGRIRSASTKDMDNPTATTCRVKARHKKNLEAPVIACPRRITQHLPDLKVSHLKTTGRTKQHTSAPASTAVFETDKGLNKAHVDITLECGNRDGKRIDSVDAPKVALHQVVHSFKARPLDKKILTSRGDIGVFRNNKRDVTVPKEFEFQTSKRTQQNLPIELFNKLSLAGESQLKNCGQVGLPQRNSIPSKGSKENRWESCQQHHQNMTHQVKQKQDTHSGKERVTSYLKEKMIKPVLVMA